MKKEDSQLRNTFKKLMDEELKDIPSFGKMTEGLDQIHIPNSAAIYPFNKLSILKYAAVLIPLGIMLFYIFSSNEELDTFTLKENWDLSTDALLPDNQQLVNIGNWQSPTDFLLKNKLTENEK